jgi:hypothetical protein
VQAEIEVSRDVDGMVHLDCTSQRDTATATAAVMGR